MSAAPSSPPTVAPPSMQQRVVEVQRRLRFNRYLHALSVTMLAAATATLVIFLADKLFHLRLDLWLPSFVARQGTATIYLAVPVCFTLLALLASLLVWGRLRVTEKESAMRIDAVCDLRERVSSAEELLGVAALESSTPQTAMEALVVEDAARVASAVIPREVAPIAMPRLARLVLFPALAALLVALFMRPMDILGRRLEAQLIARQKEQVDKIAKEIRKQASEIEHDMPLSKIDVPQTLVKELETLADELEHDKLPRQEGAMKLAQLADSMKDTARDGERDRSQLDALRRLRHDQTGEDPTDENMAGLAKALEDGDLENAAKEIKSLRDKMAAEMKKGQGGKDSKELKKQLEDLSKRLENKDPELAKQLADAANSLDRRDLDALTKALEDAGKNLSEMNDRMDAVEHLQKYERNVSELAASLLESNTCKECGKPWKDHTGKENCSKGKGAKIAQAGKKGGPKGGGEKGKGQNGKKGAGEKGAGEKGAGEKGAGEKGAGEKGEGQGGEEGDKQGSDGEARELPGDLADELTAGRELASTLETAARPRRAPPSTLERPGDAQQNGAGMGGPGRGAGGRLESGPSGSFVDKQIQAETLNEGTIIARKLKYGLPDDPGDSSVQYSTTVAEMMGEFEDALEGEGVPRERLDHVKAYLDLIKGLTPERRSGGGK